MCRRKSPSVNTPASLPRAFTTLRLPDLACVITSSASLTGRFSSATALRSPVRMMSPTRKQHRAANRAAGMQPREIALLETARLQHRHRQRVAHHEHRRRAGRRREVERTRFLGNFDVQRPRRCAAPARISGCR